MVEVKNQFGNHAIFYMFALPLALLLLMPAFLPPSTFAVTKHEVEFFEGYGSDTSEATEVANQWLKDWFVDTGVKKVFHELFVHPNLNLSLNLSSPENLHDGYQGPKAAQKATSIWNDGFWNILFKARWRFSLLWPIFLSGIIAFGIPAFIDGLAVRAKKKFDYKANNPLFFYASAHLVVFVLAGPFTLLLLPVPITSLYIGGFFACLAAMLWVSAANFQSGL